MLKHKKVAVITSKKEFYQSTFDNYFNEESYDIIYVPFQKDSLKNREKIYYVGEQAITYCNKDKLFKKTVNEIILPYLPKSYTALVNFFTSPPLINTNITDILNDISSTPSTIYGVHYFFSKDKYILNIYAPKVGTCFYYEGTTLEPALKILTSLSEKKNELILMNSKHFFKYLCRNKLYYKGVIKDVSLLYYLIYEEDINVNLLLKKFTYSYDNKFLAKYIYELYDILLEKASAEEKLPLYDLTLTMRDITIAMELNGLTLSLDKYKYEFYKKNKELERNGKFYPIFNQMTSSGRIYANAPSVTNTPRDEKTLYVPNRAGNCLFTIDFDQLEYKILASLLNDTELITSFNNNEDFHKKTASLILSKNIDTITEEERQQGKTVNFSILYGASLKNVIKNDEVIKKLNNHFKTTLSKKEEFFKTILNNKVTTPFKRTLTFKRLDEETKRKAFNFYIQSTSNDVVFTFLITLVKQIQLDKQKIFLYNIIHDASIFELNPNDVDYLKTIANNILPTIKFDWLKTNLSLSFKKE